MPQPSSSLMVHVLFLPRLRCRGRALLCRSRRPVGERPRAEMMDKEVAAAGKRVAGLSGLGAQDIRIEQAQVGPRFQRPNARQHLTLEQQTEAAQALDLQPVSLVL